MSTAHSPYPRHEDVTVSMPDGTVGVFRVVELTPFDLAACGDRFGRLVDRIRVGRSLGEMIFGMTGDALECSALTAQALDDNARKHGLRAVCDFASCRRVAEAFLRLNIFSEEAMARTGKMMASVMAMLAPESTQTPSSTPSTSSWGSATPSPTPDESRCEQSPA